MTKPKTVFVCGGNFKTRKEEMVKWIDHGYLVIDLFELILTKINREHPNLENGVLYWLAKRDTIPESILGEMALHLCLKDANLKDLNSTSTICLAGGQTPDRVRIAKWLNQKKHQVVDLNTEMIRLLELIDKEFENRGGFLLLVKSHNDHPTLSTRIQQLAQENNMKIIGLH